MASKVVIVKEQRSMVGRLAEAQDPTKCPNCNEPADCVAEVKKAFHLITDIAAQRVLDAVKEYQEGKS